MVRDNVVFRITVDGKQAQATFNALEAQVRKLGGTIDRVNPKTQQLGAGLSGAGNNAAASAVNFQTATQGMLNLSTAAVQTYTSISNLDRANNRAKQSVIAVARAEDLLNNKQERLNQLQKSGTASSAQLANMQREIATATADLTVKQEKQKIEQAAVNDIYMLFATNVANVVISSTQTLVVLLGQERSARLAATLSTKLHRVATLDSTRATITEMTAKKTAIGTTIAYSKANLGLAGSFRVAAAASKAFVASNPILIGAMAAATAALVIYESNLFGVKDKINELLGTQDDFASSLEAERNAIDEVTEALGVQQDKLFEMPSTYSGIMRKLKEVRKHYDGITTSANNATNAIVTNQQLSPNFRTGGRTSQIITNGSLNATPTAIIQGNLIPPAHAAVAPQFASPARDVIIDGFAADDFRNIGKPGAFVPQVTAIPRGGGEFAIDSPIMGFTRTATGSHMPAGITAKQKIFSIVGDMRNEVAQKISKDMGISFEEALIQVDQEEDFRAVAEQILLAASTPQAFLEQEQLGKFKRFTPESYADFKTDEKFRKQIEDVKNTTKRNIQLGATRAGLSVKEFTKRGSMRQLFQTFSPTGITLEQEHITRDPSELFAGTLTNEQIKRLGGIRRIGADIVFKEKEARLAPSLLRRALEGKRVFEDDPHMELVQDVLNISGGLIMSKNDPRLRSTTGMSPIQKDVFLKTGFNIGRVAESIGAEQAERIANIERGLDYFANTRGGQSFGVAQFLMQQGAQTITTANMLRGGRGFDGLRGRGAFFGLSATQAFQVPRGSISVPAWVREEQRNQDAFSNGAGVVYMTAVRKFFGQPHHITLGRSAARAQFDLNLDNTYMSMASKLGIFDDPNFAERLNQLNTKINARDSDAANKANNLFSEVQGMSKEYLQLNQKILNNVGIQTNILQPRTISHWKYFAGGARHAVYDYYTPAEMTADILKEIGGLGLGLGIQMDTAFLNNMAMLAKYNSTNFLNTSILDTSMSRLNVSKRDALKIRLDYRRGDNELRDRLRWRNRLDGMSTGVVVV